MFFAPIAEFWQVKSAEEMFSGTEKNRRES
jgi:hypothetical protein